MSGIDGHQGRLKVNSGIEARLRQPQCCRQETWEGTSRYWQETQRKGVYAIKGEAKGMWDMGKERKLLPKHKRLVVDELKGSFSTLVGTKRRHFSRRGLCLVSCCNLCDCFLSCTAPGQFVTSVLWALTVASTFVWVTGPHPTTAIVTLASPWMKTRRHVQVKTVPLILFQLVGPPRRKPASLQVWDTVRVFLLVGTLPWFPVVIRMKQFYCSIRRSSLRDLVHPLSL